MAKTGSLALTEEVLEKCIEYAGSGSPNYVIARAVNVHPDTFQTYLKVGREEGDSDEPSIFKRLYEGMENARAMVAIELSQKVVETAMSGMPNTWQAAMTWLERRMPAEWGKRETTIHEGKDGANVLPNINILVLNDADAREAHEQLLRAVPSPSPPRGLPVGTSDAGHGESGQARELVD